MLNRIRIKNFRCCEDVTIDEIGPIAVFVGRNGTGKTSVMEAIAMAAKTASSPTVAFDREFSGLKDETSIKLDFEANGQSFSYELAYRHVFSKQGLNVRIREALAIGSGNDHFTPLISRDGDELQIGDRQKIRIGLTASALPAIASLLPPDDEILHCVYAAIKFLGQIHYYSPHEADSSDALLISGIISEKEFVRWQEQLKAGNLLPYSTVFRIVHLFKTNPDEFERLKSYLGKNDLSLVDDIRVNEVRGGPDETAERYFVVRFVSSTSHRVLDFNFLSFGTRRVIRIVSAALSDNSTVMLVEQPEDGIHSGLMKKVVDLLRELANPTQMLITSHSIDVFNRMNPAEIKLVSIHNDATRVRGLTAIELEAAEKYMGCEGPLSDFIEMVDGE